MKLYLSSQKLGNYHQKLLDLLGENKNVAIVANALDDKTPEHRKIRVNKEFDLMKSIGLNPFELDLRDYFANPDKLKEFIEDKSLIWVRGGNVFILRRAMEAAKFDEIVLPKIKNGSIAYGGYSAGVIIVCKDLWASEIIDDIYSVPLDYPCVETSSKALGLLNFYLVPHYNSLEEWAKDVPKYVKHLKDKNKKFLTLCDGEVYYFNNSMKGVLLKNDKK